MEERYLDPDATGYEAPNKVIYKTRDLVKNQYCPIDGHYCEQPSCENCQFEATMDQEGL